MCMITFDLMLSAHAQIKVDIKQILTKYVWISNFIQIERGSASRYQFAWQD